MDGGAAGPGGKWLGSGCFRQGGKPARGNPFVGERTGGKFRMENQRFPP